MHSDALSLPACPGRSSKRPPALASRLSSAAPLERLPLRRHVQVLLPLQQSCCSMAWVEHDETPPPRHTHARALTALAVGYRNAGTVEFIVDVESGSGDGVQDYYFCEMNTRLQVRPVCRPRMLLVLLDS